MNSLTVVLLVLLASPTLGMLGPMMNPMFNPGLMNPGLMNPGLMNPGFMNPGMNSLIRRNSAGNTGDLGNLGNLGDIRGLLRLLSRLSAIRNFLDVDPIFDVLDSSARNGGSGARRQASAGAGANQGTQTGFVNSAPNRMSQF